MSLTETQRAEDLDQLSNLINSLSLKKKDEESFNSTSPKRVSIRDIEKIEIGKKVDYDSSSQSDSGNEDCEEKSESCAEYDSDDETSSSSEESKESSEEINLKTSDKGSDLVNDEEKAESDDSGEKAEEDKDGEESKKKEPEKSGGIKNQFKDVIIDGKTGKAKEEEVNDKSDEKTVKTCYLKRGIGYADNFGRSDVLSTPQPEGCNNGIQYEDNMDLNMNNDLLYNDVGYASHDYSPNSLIMSPNASPMSSYGNPPSHGSGSSYYEPNSNSSAWFDSPESSPSPYEQVDPYQYEFTTFSGDSDNETNASFNYNNFLTPPRSVSPPKMFGESSSICDQSCMKIVDLIDPFDQGGQVGAAEDELKNLLNAVEYGQDASLQGLKAYLNGNNSQKANQTNGGVMTPGYLNYEPISMDPIKSYWQDVQETDTSELNVYLPSTQLLDPAQVEEELLSACDPNTLFELESRVCTVLSNNPLAIIPDDQDGDTNLTVLASRDQSKRESLAEKIYALAKGLSKIDVCCDVHVENSRCPNCGNADRSNFYTPLTLRNVQGHTALSCAVLSNYPAPIVKYLLMLIQQNTLDLKREFSGMRNTIYLEAKDYPFLSKFAVSNETTNWEC